MKNKYGYGITKSEMNALRWANDRNRDAGSFFIVKEGWTRYIGMGRGAPTKSVQKLFDRGLLYKDEFGGKMISDRTTGPLEVYRFTERVIFVLAKHGGYKLPNGKVVKL